MGKILLVRHGETDWNKTDLVIGRRTDMDLNETGRAQAEALAASLRDEPLDAVYVSPMKRAGQTARPTAEDHGLPLITAPALIEMDYGIFEGRPRLDPVYQKEKLEFFARYPEGESYLDLAARVYPFLKEITEKHAGETVMLVTHALICRIVWTYFHEVRLENFSGFPMANTQVRRIEF